MSPAVWCTLLRQGLTEFETTKLRLGDISKWISSKWIPSNQILPKPVISPIARQLCKVPGFCEAKTLLYYNTEFTLIQSWLLWDNRIKPTCEDAHTHTQTHKCALFGSTKEHRITKSHRSKTRECHCRTVQAELKLKLFVLFDKISFRYSASDAIAGRNVVCSPSRIITLHRFAFLHRVIKIAS